jgi:hypothetical protein
MVTRLIVMVKFEVSNIIKNILNEKKKEYSKIKK